MPTFEVPKQPEIVFGVWDRHGQQVTARTTSSATVGFKIEPSYAGYRSIYKTIQEVPEYALRREIETYNTTKKRLMLQAIDISSFLNGKTIQTIEIIDSGYPTLDIALAEGPGVIRLRGNRWNYAPVRTQVPPPENGPMVVKRWLKTGKTIRLTNGLSIELSFYGRLKLQNVPDWFLKEMFGVAPSP